LLTVRGTVEPLVGNGLEQVIHGVGVEGLDRVLVERGDEHDPWPQRRALPAARHLEAGDARHPDVEKRQVGPLRLDLPQGLFAVAGHGDDL
jgi:hypothetical protein